MKEAVFSIDGNGAFVGFHNPDRNWNGWAIPYFTKGEAERVLNELEGDYWSWSYDEATDTFTLTETENSDVTTYTGEQTDCGKLYCIGGQYLCWVAEDDKTFFHKDHSGRDGHYSMSLIDMVSDIEMAEEFDDTEEDDRENTVIGYAMNAEIGDTYSDNASEWTRTA